MDRRTLLALAGTTLVAASAGCNDGSDDDGTDSENSTGGTNSSEASGDDTTGETDNGDDTDEYTDESGRVPAAVVRGFYEAVGTGDVDAVSALVHEDVAGEVSDEDVVEADWEFVSVETTITDETPDPSEVPVTRLPEDERVVVVRGEPTVRGADGAERTLRPREFIVATENGRWQLWDLVAGFFHDPPQSLDIEAVTGLVGAPGEVHEVRFTVTPGSESGAVNLAALQIAFLGPEKTDLYVDAHEGERASGETSPENVEPGVFDRESRPDDRYGVAVVEAEQPDNITMTAADDRYELVVDTSGGTTEAGVDRLAPLVPGDEVGVVVTTRTRQQFETTFEIPTLDEFYPGDRVDLQE